MLEECARVGRDPASFRFIHYSALLPGASREAALARYRDALWSMQWKYRDMEASASRPLPPPAPPAFRRTDEALLGIRQKVQVSVEFVARSYLPLIGYEEQVELMQELAEGVAPHV